MQSKSRKKFDEYTRKYLHLTQRYNSFQELLNNPPEADIYFCGSDQIWNTQIKNGLDPAFIAICSHEGNTCIIRSQFFYFSNS